jgi:AraC-like DNA-binding protein
MRVIRESTHQSGYLFEQPLVQLPALTHCGEALTARGHLVGPHVHEGFEFHYLSRGQYAWRVEDQTFDQQMGDVFVNFPRELHHSESGVFPPSHFLWLGLRLSLLGDPGRRLARLLRRKNCRILRGCHETEPILRGLMSQLIHQREHRAETALAYVRTLVAVLEQRLLSGAFGANGDDTCLPFSDGVQHAVAYLERNLDRRIPLAELAAVAMMRHVPQFGAQFKREVGVTPAAHHHRLRLLAAREALSQPAFTITMAALQHGFSSSQHFSSSFRREFGVSPAQWQSGI